MISADMEHSPTTLAPAAMYWRNTKRLTLTLLGIWFMVTFVAIFFARQLDRVTLFGWPLSFYMAAQGVMLIYLLIVLVYAVFMRRAELQLPIENEPPHGE
jgi:putative solute:sodium symporter small subunit